MLVEGKREEWKSCRYMPMSEILRKSSHHFFFKISISPDSIFLRIRYIMREFMKLIFLSLHSKIQAAVFIKEFISY